MRWSRLPTAAAALLRSKNASTGGSNCYDAVRVHQTGDPSVLQYDQNLPCVPLVAAQQQVRVSIRSIGVNFHDTYTRTGLYPIHPLPFTVGCEAAGVVTEVGDNAPHKINIGDRVAFFEYNTGYASEAVVHQDSCFVLPDSVSFELGAAALVQGLTAHYLAHDSFALCPGRTCLVHAAGGGTGNLLVQMAKLSGAAVVATSSPGAKADAAKDAGADHVITYRDDHYDFLSEVQRLYPDGVDVVYDSIGLQTAETSLQCLKPRGTCVLYGNASGAPKAILPTPTLATGSWYVQRPVLQHFLLDEKERQKRSSDLFGWIASKDLHVRIAKTFALEEAAEAHRFLESRQAVGKVLLSTGNTTI